MQLKREKFIIRQGYNWTSESLFRTDAEFVEWTSNMIAILKEPINFTSLWGVKMYKYR